MRSGPSRIGLAIALVFVALNLRIAIAAVSPVLGEIQRDVGLSSSAAGLLTTVPVVCFGVFAFAAPSLLRRLGPNRLLWLSMLGVVIGAAVRLAPSLTGLFVGTAIIGAAIAVGNVLLPGLIKRDFPHRVGLLTGLYTMALSGGAALSAGLTVPLQEATGAGWRLAVAAWGVPAIVAVVVWSSQLRQTTEVVDVERRPVRGLWRDRVAWSVAVFMGLQSLGYYSALAWIPTLFQYHHLGAGKAGWLLSFSTFPAMAASLCAPILARRSTRPWVMVVAAVGLCALGYLGLIAAPVALAYLWMTLLGLGQGAAVSLALGYIVVRSPDTRHTAKLSMMAQGTGYLIASVGPLGLGALHDLSGGWVVPLLALTAVLVPELAAGLGACKERYVLAATNQQGPGARLSPP